MSASYRPTNRDLARPSSVLPRTVLRDIGVLLLEGPVGDWETVGEELGFSEDDLASLRQGPAPGASMLERWARRGPASTLYVLYIVLRNVDREDCLRLLERSIYNRVVCVTLIVCIKHEGNQEIDHVTAQVRADANLLESLTGHLESPLEANFRLLDPGVTWAGSIAKDFRGRQLTLLKLSKSVPMEQDPTVDSSVNFDSTANGNNNTSINYNPGHCTSYLNIPSENMDTSPNSSNLCSIETNISPIAKVPTRHSGSFSDDNNSDPTVFSVNIATQREARDTFHDRNKHTQEMLEKPVDSQRSSKCPMTECRDDSMSSGKGSAKSGAKVTVTMERNMKEHFDEYCKKPDDEKFLEIRKSCKDFSNVTSFQVSSEDSCAKHSFSTSVSGGKDKDVHMRNDCNIPKQNSMDLCSSEGSDYCDSMKSQTTSSVESFSVRGMEDGFRCEIVSGKHDIQCEDDFSTGHLCTRFNGCSSIEDKNDAVRIETVTDLDHVFGAGIHVESSVTVTPEKINNWDEHTLNYYSDDSITQLKEFMLSQERNRTEIVDINRSVNSTRCENRELANSCTSYIKISYFDDYKENGSCFDEAELSDDSITELKRFFAPATETCVNESTQEQTEEHNSETVRNSRNAFEIYTDYDASGESDGNNDYEFLEQTLSRPEESHYDCFRSRQKTQMTIADIPKPRNLEQDKDTDSSVSDEKVRRKRPAVSPGRYNRRRSKHIQGGGTSPIFRLEIDQNNDMTVDTTSESPASDNGMEQGHTSLPISNCIHEQPSSLTDQCDLNPLSNCESSLNRSQQSYSVNKTNQSVSAIKHCALKRSKPVTKMRYPPRAITNPPSKSGIDTTARMTATQISEKIAPGMENISCCEPDSNESHGLSGVSQNGMQQTDERHFTSRSNSDFSGISSVTSSSSVSSSLVFSSTVSGHVNSVIFSPEVAIINSNPSGVTVLSLPGSFSSRSLDHLLDGDLVFDHYYAILQDYPGWCPRETDYTVPKTMAGALNHPGTYMIWYCRKKHCLVITLSFAGRLIHCRIHVKVHNTGKSQYFTYFMKKDLQFTNIIGLLENYQAQGVAIVVNEASNRAPGCQQLVPMATAVWVQYNTRYVTE